MTTQTAPRVLEPEQTDRLSRGIVRFLETNAAPEGLLRSNVFCDLSLPTWRLQTDSVQALVRLRREQHPDLGRVTCLRAVPAADGLVIEVEERWTDARGESWYAREMIRASVVDGQIAEMSVYCTGDWDTARQAEHAAAVTLPRP